MKLKPIFQIITEMHVGLRILFLIQKITKKLKIELDGKKYRTIEKKSTQINPKETGRSLLAHNVL